jgi:hypothetical protein
MILSLVNVALPLFFPWAQSLIKQYKFETGISPSTHVVNHCLYRHEALKKKHLKLDGSFK